MITEEIIMSLDTIIYITISLFVIMDPPGALPLIIRITYGLDKNVVLRLALEVAIFVMLFLSLFATLGKYILDYFGISIPSLKIAGGIMLAVMGFEMMKEGEKPRSRREAVISEEEAFANAIVPLGSPMLAGPGAISLAVIYGSLYGYHLTIFGIIINSIILIPTIFFAGYVNKIMRERGVRVLTRVLGFFVLALAVQYILEGVSMYINSSGFGV